MIAAPTLKDLELAPLASAAALHPAFYAGQEWLDFERREIFSKSWQLAGPASEVSNPGDHVVIEIAGASILIARGQDGTLRGFHNICRHRAGPVAQCSAKGAKRFRCAYHGWTYELDGALRAAPEMQDAENFNRSANGLYPVQVNERQGLVFVALSQDAPSFDDVYGGVAERIAPQDLSRMRYDRREVWPVACNWKVYVDNYLEGYHVPAVHPELNEIVDYKGYTTELGEWRSAQTSTLAPSAAYAVGRVFYWHIFPNVMLNVVPGRIQTNRVIPDGPDRCLVEFDYYYADDPAVTARAEADAAFSAQVQEEDRLICEAVQKNLRSGFYTPGRLCPKREEAVWHFQNLLRKAYARAFL
jgi:choline monooxygenase